MSASEPGADDGHATLARLRRGELAGATRLALACGLEHFPPEIFTLADTLEVLDLSGNQLSELPADLARLHRLRILFCSDNRFTQLPPALGACAQLEMVGFKANQISEVPGAALPPALRWLILTDNRIAALPDAIGRCTRLQKLMLAGNRLRELPASLAHCTGLELLRISANDFEVLPPVLEHLPQLSWLAAGGNPWCAGAEAAAAAGAQAEAIAWDALSLGPLLGEGASGQIFAAQWQRGDGLQDVAVKLFKGAVTSDGWPASERAASIAAGSQAQLIGLLGTVAGHPQGAQGIVMPRVAEGFRNLARPPSFASCTRDVYDADFAPSPQAAWRLAQGVAAAMAHLHARGVVHGDLYGHNILWDGAHGEALLGDFGAAFVLPPAVDAAPLQARDVRAFGCLLGELMAHCAAPPAPLAPWAALRDACLGAAAARPPFSQIASRLDSLRPA